MAITNNGTKNSLPAAQIPTGHTRNAPTEFTDWEYKRELTLSVLKATVDEATADATMTAIFNNATIGLDKQIVDIIAADYLATATVTTWADCTALTLSNAVTSSGSGVWLLDTAASYVATVTLYVKAA